MKIKLFTFSLLIGIISFGNAFTLSDIKEKNQTINQNFTNMVFRLDYINHSGTLKSIQLNSLQGQNSFPVSVDNSFCPTAIYIDNKEQILNQSNFPSENLSILNSVNSIDALNLSDTAYLKAGTYIFYISSLSDKHTIYQFPKLITTVPVTNYKVIRLNPASGKLALYERQFNPSSNSFFDILTDYNGFTEDLSLHEYQVDNFHIYINDMSSFLSASLELFLNNHRNEFYLTDPSLTLQFSSYDVLTMINNGNEIVSISNKPFLYKVKP